MAKMLTSYEKPIVISEETGEVTMSSEVAKVVKPHLTERVRELYEHRKNVEPATKQPAPAGSFITQNGAIHAYNSFTDRINELNLILWQLEGSEPDEKPDEEEELDMVID